MNKYWKNRKRFISDWAKIWIWCISFILFANMISFAQVYAKKCEDELMNKFEIHCVEEIERSLDEYEIHI